uniref:DUF2428 domain-containing protein n=1 Tax=Parastrongyloides trichosuri TaxID=131310 RepID=A0A0N4ZQD7_PARTI
MNENIEKFYPTIGAKTAVELGEKVLKRLQEEEKKEDILILHELVYKIDIMKFVEFKNFIKTSLVETCKKLLEKDYLSITSAYLMDMITQCYLMEYYYFGKVNDEEIKCFLDNIKSIDYFKKSPIHCLCIYILEKAMDSTYNGIVLKNWNKNIKKLKKNTSYEEKFFTLVLQYFHSFYEVYEEYENIINLLFDYSLRKGILKKVVIGLTKNSYLIMRKGNTFVPMLIKCMLRIYSEQFNNNREEENYEPASKKSKTMSPVVNINPISESILSISICPLNETNDVLKKLSKNEHFLNYHNELSSQTIVDILDIFEEMFVIFKASDDYYQLFSALFISMKSLTSAISMKIIKYLSKMLSMLNTTFLNDYILKITFEGMINLEKFVEKFNTQEVHKLSEFIGTLLVTKTQVKEYKNSEKMLKYLTSYLKNKKIFNEITNGDIIIIITFTRVFHVINMKRHIGMEYFEDLKDTFISLTSTVNILMSNIPKDNTQEINFFKILEKYATLFNVISILKYILKEINMDGKVIEDNVVNQIYKLSTKCLSESYFHELVLATYDISLLFTESFNFLFYAHQSLGKQFQVLKWKFLCKIVKNNENLMNKVLETNFTNNDSLNGLLENLKPYSFDELDLTSIFKVISCIATKRNISFVPVVPYLTKGVLTIQASIENIVSSLDMLKSIIENVKNDKVSIGQVITTTILIMSAINYKDFIQKEPKFIISSLNIFVSTLRNVLKCECSQILSQASLIGGIIGKLTKAISEVRYLSSYNVNPSDILHCEYYLALVIKSLQARKDTYRRISPYIASDALGCSRKLTLPYMNLLSLCDNKGIDLISTKLPLVNKQRFTIIYKHFAKYRVSVG